MKKPLGHLLELDQFELLFEVALSGSAILRATEHQRA